MSTLVATLAAAVQALLRPAERAPTRVGLLNTGEPVLVDATGAAQVISAATTALIREQLINTDIAASELVLFPGGHACTAPAADDPARMHG